MAILPDSPENYNLETITIVLTRVIQLALTIAGGIAAIYLIIAGFQYFTAFGNEEKATKAKTTILWAIVGIVVIILAKVIIYEVWKLLSKAESPFLY